MDSARRGHLPRAVCHLNPLFRDLLQAPSEPRVARQPRMHIISMVDPVRAFAGAQRYEVQKGVVAYLKLRRHPFEWRQRHHLPRRPADHAIVDHGARLPNGRVIIGELEIDIEALVERRSLVVNLQHAVDPGLEEAIGIFRPPHVIDEVVPDVLHERANVRAVAVLVSTALDNSRSALAAECEQPARVDEDVEIRLSSLTARVVEIENRGERTRLRRRDRKVVRKHDRVRPPLFPALNAQRCSKIK